MALDQRANMAMDALISWLSLILAVAALAGVGGLFWYTRRQHASYTRSVEQTYFDLQQTQLSALQRDVKALLARLERLEHSDVQAAANSAGQTSGGSAATPSATPYNQAIELARQGMPAAEVATRCGISRSEAELIVALYRRARS